MSTPATMVAKSAQEQRSKEQSKSGRQDSKHAMILIKDHSKAIVQSLVQVKLIGAEIKPKSFREEKKDAAVLITLGPHRRTAAYFLLKVDMVFLLANWILTMPNTQGFQVEFQILPKAGTEPNIQKDIAMAIKVLHDIQHVKVSGFSPKTVGTELKNSMISPVRTWKERFQKIEAFRQRSVVELSAWQEKCKGNPAIHERLINTLETSLRCLDVYYHDFRNCADFDFERFEDRYMYMMAELVYAQSERPGAGDQDVLHAKDCLLKLRDSEPPDVARAMVYVRLCILELRSLNLGTAAKYLAELEQYELTDKSFRLLKRKVKRMIAKAVDGETKVDM